MHRRVAIHAIPTAPVVGSSHRGASPVAQREEGSSPRPTNLPRDDVMRPATKVNGKASCCAARAGESGKRPSAMCRLAAVSSSRSRQAESASRYLVGESVVNANIAEESGRLAMLYLTLPRVALPG